MVFTKRLFHWQVRLFTLSALVFFAAIPVLAVEAPDGLMTELLEYPAQTVITDTLPEFSWIVNDNDINEVQAAYQILVATSAEKLLVGQVDVWDSGKVLADTSVNVEFGGSQLPSGKYWWCVRTWDKGDESSPFSAAQEFVVNVDHNPSRALAPNRYIPSAHEIPAETVIADGRRYFIDFGKAAFGTLEFDADIPAGETARVEIRFGEKRKGNRVKTRPGGSIVYHSMEVDIPGGRQTVHIDLDQYKPHRRTFFDPVENTISFRYAEIIGLPVAPTNVKQIAYWVPFNEGDSSFTSNNPILNQVWELSRYSMKVLTWLGIYVDGIRETLPYEADAFIQQLGHYSTTREFTTARYSHEYLIEHATWPTEWLSHSVLMAYYDWMYTGNTDSLALYYDDLKAKSLIALVETNKLISTRTGKVDADFLASVHRADSRVTDIVDWPKGERDGYVFTDYNTVVNAFYNYSLNLMKEMAQALEMSDEVSFWEARIAAHTPAFQNQMFNDSKGVYRDGVGTTHSSSHANFFALAFGLVPPEHLESVADFVVSRGMAPSVYGAQYLLDGLYAAGKAQEALDLMTSTAERSWWNMIQEGSTVTLEAWGRGYKRNLDWNHAWGAAPANIIPRQLMGVTPLEPGFKKIRIKPQIGNLTFAYLTLPTVRGPVSVRIDSAIQRDRYVIDIPANTVARVYIAAKGHAGNTVNVDGIDVEGVRSDGFIVFDDIGSGEHTFIRYAPGMSDIPGTSLGDHPQ